MTSLEKNASIPEAQLARFGELSKCLTYAPGVLLEQGFELFDIRLGGVGLPAGSEIPEWLRFMAEVCRWRLGSAVVATGDVRRKYGISDVSITNRLASVGVTYDQIQPGVREPRVEEVINTVPWLWGYSRERERLTPSPDVMNMMMQRHATNLGIAEGIVAAVDTQAIARRIHAVAAPFGFQSRKSAFGMDFLFHRSSETGMGSYIGIDIFTDKRIPFPTVTKVLVMPDVDFVSIDAGLKRNFESGSLFTPLAQLGLASFYMRAYTPQLLELSLREAEISLATVLPALVAICDEAPHGE
ncbi:MAG TPA: hypothetical protein VM621_18070 [Luteibacter sp.]|uniref:hypothetical protein n=1 Tax=Luteibacter sp. TaxID=1886636 RepID=UPI002BF2FA36|nr:hypothetical protein [Luteibacter sp.]HVI56952.1 hypothetical protein [Luteibacter sp.]